MAENLEELAPPGGRRFGQCIPLFVADPYAGRHRGAAGIARAETARSSRSAGIDSAPLRRHCACPSTARTRRWNAFLAGNIRPGDVVVIRYEGPKGRPRYARDARGHGPR